MDVTLNLEISQQSHYRKSNQYLKYSNIISNHHKSTFDNIVNSITIHISDRPSTEEMFENHAPYYNQAFTAGNTCPLQTHCERSNVIYKRTILNTILQNYIGSSINFK